MSSKVVVEYKPEKDPEYPWRAKVSLAKSVPWPFPVQGQRTEGGPWVEGVGTSVDAAIRDAQTIIGRAAMHIQDAVEVEVVQ